MIDACGTDTGECTHCGRWHDSLCSGARQDITGEMAQELAIWKRRALAAEDMVEQCVKLLGEHVPCVCGRATEFRVERTSTKVVRRIVRNYR